MIAFRKAAAGDKSNGTPRRLALGLCATVVATLALAAPASAAFGIEGFTGGAFDAGGQPDARAGAHPYSASTQIRFNLENGPFTPVDDQVKTIRVSLPAGFVGNPSALPRCRYQDLLPGTPAVHCPVGSQIGVATFLTLGTLPFTTVGIYNMEPPVGMPAQFAMNVANNFVAVNPEIRPDDHGIDLVSKWVSEGIGLSGADVAIWGVPSDPSHDADRFCGIDSEIRGCASDVAPIPVLTAPTRCTGEPVTTTMRADSWENPGVFASAAFTTPEVFGCSGLPFAPSVDVRTSSSRADSPTGLAVDLTFPQDGLQSEVGLATAHLKMAKVTFPEGMTINPTAANGLDACSDAQIGLSTDVAASCPDASKIGTVEATTPLIDEPLSGGVYVGSQQSDDPASGDMFRIFLILANEERGIRVKLGGNVKADPSSGRLEAVFDNNPQLPVSSVELQLKSGPRAPLATPPTCGKKTVNTQLTSWAGHVVDFQNSFQVDCAPGLGSFSPSFSAGTVNPLAGASSPFVLKIHKPDGQSDLNGVSLTMPDGLLATLRGNLGTRIGTARVGAGPGPSPFWLGGPVVLEGPYGDAPLSLRVTVPAVAGPFNLGEVVVRQKVYVDPTTAQVRVVSDPLPTVVKGVPVRLQDLTVEVDKPGFVLNPTDCTAKKVEATLGSAAGQSVEVESRFQVGSCERLAFGPKLALSIKGGHKRGAYQRLKAVLTQPKGQANIGKVSVALPHSQFLAQEHIRTICTRVQFSADQCPAGSIYGKATAWSPLLDQPLSGPVYLRSSSNPLPDLVAALHGQIDIDLAGRIDSVNGGIRNTFNVVPDAPVSKFVLEMKGGKKSLLVNSRDICKSTSRATVKMDGQNGKTHDFNPVLRDGCGKKARKPASNNRGASK